MKVLGIDPGLKATGYGVIETPAVPGTLRQVKLLECGTVEPRQKDQWQDKLVKIYQHLKDIIEQYSPDVMVLEKLYAHHSYPTTAFILGHVRGVICLVCARNNITLEEYSVKRTRKALVGNGNATKQQTREQVAHILQIEAQKLTLDASDALALALGYVHMQRFLG